jgi:hypothetical protein
VPFSSLADPLSIKVWMRTWDEVDKVRVRSGARVDDCGERNLQELHFEPKKRPPPDLVRQRSELESKRKQ